MRQAVARDPLGERLGQAVADRLLHVGRRERIERADQVIERHPRLRLGGDVVVEPLARELVAEVMAQVVVQELGAVGVVAVEAVEPCRRRRAAPRRTAEATTSVASFGTPVREVVHLGEVVAGRKNRGSSSSVMSIGWP